MEFSQATIQSWRSLANRAWSKLVPAQAPKGWSICPVDPAILLPAFPRLFLLPRMRLQAYQYRWGRDGHALVYALPAGQELPAPALESEEPPRPAGALSDVMGAIGGDASLESYLQASILGRELQEFCAMGHGRMWSFYAVLGEDVWSNPGSISPNRTSPAEIPQRYTWSQKMPADFLPRAEQTGSEIRVTFYTYTGLSLEEIVLNEDTFQAGTYTFSSNPQLLAKGNQGFRI